MEWVGAALISKGPWALCLGILISVAATLFIAFKNGAIVPASQVDRLIATYDKMLADKAEQVVAWQTAHALEAENSKMLREQNGQLLAHSSVAAHAWDSIRAAAERAGADAA
jgi:hypothetical protein